MLLSLASSLNSVPLPPILDRYGMKLPPPRHCLTNVNFSLVPNPPPQDYSEDDAPGEDEEDEMDTSERDDAVTNGMGRGTGTDAATKDAEDVPEAPTPEQRGRKRSLDEDEDYD
jgi:transcription initiation factor TFIID subunit 9B